MLTPGRKDSPYNKKTLLRQKLARHRAKFKGEESKKTADAEVLINAQKPWDWREKKLYKHLSKWFDDRFEDGGEVGVYRIC